MYELSDTIEGPDELVIDAEDPGEYTATVTPGDEGPYDTMMTWSAAESYIEVVDDDGLDASYKAVELDPSAPDETTDTVICTLNVNGNEEDASKVVNVIGNEAKFEYKYGDMSDFEECPETLYVPLDAEVEFKVSLIDPTASWPTDKPEWGGEASSTATGEETASVTFDATSENEDDTKTVSVTYGDDPEDEFSVDIVTVGIVAVEVKPMEGGSWGGSGDIAVGGKDSEVHKANIRLQMTCSVPSDFMFDLPDIDYYSSDGPMDGTTAAAAVKGTITFDYNAQDLEGGSSDPFTVSSIDIDDEGYITGTVVSSNLVGSSSLNFKCGDDAYKSATLDFKWNYTSGSSRWDYPELFEYDQADDVSYQLEIESGSGIPEHSIQFWTEKVTYEEFNFSTFSFDEHTATENLDIYTKFTGDAGGDKSTTGSDGKATAQQIIYGEPGGDWFIWVTEVKFAAYDLDAFSE